LRKLSLLLLFFLSTWLLTNCREQPETTAPPTPAEPADTTGISPEADSPSTALPATSTAETNPDAVQAESTDVVLVPMVISSQATDTPPPAPTSQPGSPPAEPAPTATPKNPAPSDLQLDRDQFGVQIHLHREDLGLILSHLRTLGVGWVKVQVSWKIYEPEPGRYDDYRFNELDNLVAEASANDIDVLLGVAKAPEWSRPTTEMDGPPSDYTRFQAFMETLATRYQGQVAAYELWNEANLQREWNGAPLSAADLVALIRAGAAGVRAADPGAILISGAPATTGINDGVTAIDDRVFMGQMIAAGVADVVDAIGAHPYGWANPPDSSASAPAPNVLSHNNHPSFFFADTLRDYRALLDQGGYQEEPIWVTEFGWGSYDGFGVGPPLGVEYMAAVDAQQQAIYTVRAYEMASESPGIGPLILWNLNFAPTFGEEYVESAYSLLGLDGAPRPVYIALSALDKQD
jgi:hypothetical protein